MGPRGKPTSILLNEHSNKIIPIVNGYVHISVHCSPLITEVSVEEHGDPHLGSGQGVRDFGVLGTK